MAKEDDPFSLGPLVTFQWLLLFDFGAFDGSLTRCPADVKLESLHCDLWNRFCIVRNNGGRSDFSLASPHPQACECLSPPICLCPKEIDHWVVVSNILCFHPETWGNDPI